MDQLIPIASKLQDVLGAVVGVSSSSSSSSSSSGMIDLPQIVVVGGQSSGKSSVLESIVGRSFLPRGTGIVTRRPLILQLYNTSNSNNGRGTNGRGSGSGTSTGSTSISSSSSSSRQKQSSSTSTTTTANAAVVVVVDDDTSSDAVVPTTETTPPEEWGEFLHQSSASSQSRSSSSSRRHHPTTNTTKKYYDFTQIRQEIINETERVTGKNRGIAMEPIHLKIYSPRVLNLTLVDLPGMAKVPVGDQPIDIETQIRTMVLHYISNPNAIILAVTAANTDLANSDALQLAHHVDPHGLRTVGVLTKVDLMDPGTDCADVLMNLVIPLPRHGYIAVVNRGQKDIDADKSIRDGLKKEDHFFRKHTSYSRDTNVLMKCGTGRLAKTLNGILMHHIRECLPDLKSRIGSMLNDVQRDLDALGDSSSSTIPTHRSGRSAALLQILSKFTNNFGSLLDGKGCKDLECSKTSTFVGGGTTTGTDRNSRRRSSITGSHTTTNHTATNSSSGIPGISSGGCGSSAIATELEGGARISYIFTDIFASSLVSVGAFDALTDDEIRATIRNANGTRPALFVPEISFDILVRRQIARLEQPGVQCVDLVYEELQRIALQSQPTELTRYPVLRDRMLEVVSGLLRKSLLPTQMMITSLIKIELAYINTSHPDFIGGSRAVAKLMERIGQDNDRERQRQAKLIAQTTGTTAPLESEYSSNANNTAMASSSLHNQNTNNNYDNTRVANIENEEPVVGGTSELYGNQNANNNGIFHYLFRPNAPIEDIHLSPTQTMSSKQNYVDKKRESLGPPNVVHLPPVSDMMTQSTSMPPTDRERVEMDVIKSLVESYFVIIRKNFIDIVPKTIMYLLVNHTRDTMQNDLVSELYRNDEISHLLKEADDIAQRRQSCHEMKDLLNAALDVVNEVRDFNSFK